MSDALWSPSAERVRDANLTRFTRLIAERTGRSFADYDDLWSWSIDDRETFWRAIWDLGGVVAREGSDRVLVDGDRMPGARWFPDARLSFAENLLRHRGPGAAIIARDERGRRREVSRDELAGSVAALAAALRDRGVGPGDRVAGFLPNVPEAGGRDARRQQPRGRLVPPAPPTSGSGASWTGSARSSPGS